jgi:diguanylate cyclase (GGDEF)-like protein
MAWLHVWRPDAPGDGAAGNHVLARAGPVVAGAQVRRALTDCECMFERLRRFMLESPLWVTIPLIVLASVGSSVGVLLLLTEVVGVARSDNLKRSLTVATLAPMLVSGPIGGYVVHLLRKVESARRLAQALAWNDELTKLLNRRRLTETGTRELTLTQRSGQPLAAILIDVDDFKRINDHFGHQGGDSVLRALGAALPRTLRSTDLLGRWGGEEFALVLPNTGAMDGAALAERLRSTVQALEIPVGEGQPLRCTISLGLTCARPGDNFDSLIDRADQAMYRAKGSGKNRVETLV